jgi:uncharacterized phage protein (TIGR01671 family)
MKIVFAINASWLKSRRRRGKMREIEFRGKDTETGEWVYGNYIDTGSRMIIDGNAMSEGDFHFYHDVIPTTIGQYAGLTDKDGRKIFEGDKVRYRFEYSGEDEDEGFDDWEYATVEWHGGCGYPAFDLSPNEMDFNALANIFQSGDYMIEIIGNIHDTPELLAEGEKG